MQADRAYGLNVDELAELSRHNREMEANAGGGGGDDYLDLSRFQAVAGNLPEEIDKLVSGLDPTNNEAKMALREKIDELKMLAPHPEALEALDLRLADEAKTKDDVAYIWAEFQATPGLDRADLIAGRKLYDLAKLIKPGAWEIGPEVPPGVGYISPLGAPELEDAWDWQMQKRHAHGAYGRMF